MDEEIGANSTQGGELDSLVGWCLFTKNRSGEDYYTIDKHDLFATTSVNLSGFK